MSTVDRYETVNSIYDIDWAGWQYRRSPNLSTCYQAPEIRNPQGSQRLIDGEWKMLSTLLDHAPPVRVENDQWGEPVLRIFGAGSIQGIITSPIVKTELAVEALKWDT